MPLTPAELAQMESMEKLDALGFLVPQAGGEWLSPSQVAERAKRAGASSVRMSLVDSLSPEDMARWNNVKDATHFLVRNNAAATGERYRCARVYGGSKCNQQHDFFTCMCIPLPFKGLEEALYAFCKNSYDAKLESRLMTWAPELATGHPTTARKLRPANKGESELIAVAIGTVEPITVEEARKYANSINLRRPPQRVRV